MGDQQSRWRDWWNGERLALQRTGIVRARVVVESPETVALAKAALERAAEIRHVTSADRTLDIVGEVPRGTVRDVAKRAVRGWVRELDRLGVTVERVEVQLEQPAPERGWYELVAAEGTPVEDVRDRLAQEPLLLLNKGQEPPAAPSGTRYESRGPWATLDPWVKAYLTAQGLGFLASSFDGLPGIRWLWAPAVVALIVAVRGWLRRERRGSARNDSQAAQTRSSGAVARAARSAATLRQSVGGALRRVLAGLSSWFRPVRGALLGVLGLFAMWGMGWAYHRGAQGTLTWSGILAGLALLAAYCFVISLVILVLRSAGARRGVWLASAAGFVASVIGVQSIIERSAASIFLSGLGAPHTAGLDAGVGALLVAAPVAIPALTVTVLAAGVVLAMLWRSFSAITVAFIAPLLVAVTLGSALVVVIVEITEAGVRTAKGDLETTGHLASRVCVLDAGDHPWLASTGPYVLLSTTSGKLLLGPAPAAGPTQAPLPVRVTEESLTLAPAIGACR